MIRMPTTGFLVHAYNHNFPHRSTSHLEVQSSPVLARGWGGEGGAGTISLSCKGQGEEEGKDGTSVLAGRRG